VYPVQVLVRSVFLQHIVQFAQMGTSKIQQGLVLIAHQSALGAVIMYAQDALLDIHYCLDFAALMGVLHAIHRVVGLAILGTI